MRLTQNEARRKLGKGAVRVFLDGRDVSAECFAFDTGAGYVDLFEREPDGSLRRIRVNGQERIATNRTYGIVTTDPDVLTLSRLAGVTA